EVLIPLVLALLLSFLLAPAVRGLERLRFKRVPAVLVVVAVAFGTIFLLGWVVGNQVVGLAESIPRYHDEILAKVSRLRGHGGGIGDKIGELRKEISAATGGSNPATQASAEARGQIPSHLPTPGTPGNP